MCRRLLSLGCRGKKHLCSSGLVCGCGSMRNGWVCSRTAGNTYASEGMTQLLLALTLLSTPQLHCPGTELSWVTSPFLGIAFFFPVVPLRLLKWVHMNSCMLFCSKSSPPASFPLAPARIFWEVQPAQILMWHMTSFSTLEPKINRNHSILILITINDSPYKQNKHIVFSYD